MYFFSRIVLEILRVNIPHEIWKMPILQSEDVVSHYDLVILEATRDIGYCYHL
jgi:hypothetical protein